MLLGIASFVYNGEVNLFAIGFFLAGVATTLTGLMSRSQGESRRSRQ
jgi:hypothetical protein